MNILSRAIVAFITCLVFIRLTEAQIVDPKQFDSQQWLKFISEDHETNLYAEYNIPSGYKLNLNDNGSPKQNADTLQNRVKRFAEELSESIETTTVRQGKNTLYESTTTEIPDNISDQDSCDKLKKGEDLEEYLKNNSTSFSTTLLRCILIEMEEVKKATLAPQLKKAISSGDKYLPKDYNKFEVPIINVSLTHSNGSVVRVVSPPRCELFLSIRAIRDFDGDSEEITLDMDIILAWLDGNILKNVNIQKLNESGGEYKQKFIFLDPSFLDKIWKPDIYIQELVSLNSPTIMGNSKSLMFFPSIGKFVYQLRVIAKFSCEMDFFYYPADTQECKFNVKSYSFNTERFLLYWFQAVNISGVYLKDPNDPNFDFQVESSSIENKTFFLGPEGNDSNDDGDKFTTLTFNIIARRKMSFQVIQTYIPSTFFVIVTWLCFLIPSENFEVRVGIAMTTMLTLTAMFASVRETTPKVSYVKAIDIWMVTCVLFLFAALTAFTGTVWIKKVTTKLNEADETESKDQTRRKKLKIQLYNMLNNFIESYLPLLMSTSFVIFVFVYWVWLLVASGHLDWEINEMLNAIDN